MNSYGMKILDRTLEGLINSRTWAEKSKEAAEQEVAKATEEIAELNRKIDEIAKDLMRLT